MTPHAAIRARYLRDAPTIRLGGLAANLARVRSFSEHPDHQEEVARLVEESAFFIEWTAPDVAQDILLALAELQRVLLGWRRRWDAVWCDPNQRAQMAEEAGDWSQRVLHMAGLLP